MRRRQVETPANTTPAASKASEDGSGTDEAVAAVRKSIVMLEVPVKVTVADVNATVSVKE